MPGKTIKIRSTDGGEFDCYLASPRGGDKVPAVVLACAVHGVDADIRQLAEEFAGHGFIAAAPDLFWRTVPGPLGHDDKRTQERSQPRLEKIKTGERDMVDTLTYLKTLPQFNGRAATMGFCYGGPYAILGPKRLGYAAGISCHGSQMLDYIRRARRRHRAGLHHLGRPGSSRAAGGAGRLPPGAVAHEERRGAYLPGHPARLHDAGQPEGLRPEDARLLDAAGARDPRWLARRRRGDAQGVVVSPAARR